MHEHNANKLVRGILKKLAKQEKRPFPEIKWCFINGNSHLTHRFWEILAKEKPKHKFTDVYHCPGCNKFSLE